MHTSYEVPDEGLVILNVRGDVDIYAAPTFKEALFDCLDLGPRHLIVDMSGSAFIDSTGLGVLIAALKQRRGCQFAVVCGGSDLQRIFSILGLDRVIALCATRSEAICAFASEPSGA
jgi:anti-sigma B factor antagonist